MRILVCGGRDFAHVVRTTGLIKDEPPETRERLKEYRFVHDHLAALTTEHSKFVSNTENWLPTDIVLIAGGAKGVDSAAADFAVCNYCQLEEYKADWKQHGKAAGPIRNKQMLDEGKPDLVIAFPGGKGTANMVKQAKAKGVKVQEIKYEA